MHSKFKETLLGVGVCWLALHAVALFIYTNGQATSDNLAWQMLSFLLAIERAALIFCAATLVVVASFIVITNLLKSADHPPKSEEVSAFATPVKAEAPSYKSAQITDSLHISDPPKPPKIITPLPPKPPPTAKELKQKAIEQITGRRFL